MRFSAIHKVTSYLMVASAFASLALARELSPALGAELRAAACGHAPHLEAPASVVAALLDLHRRIVRPTANGAKP